jgi:hypothetical protein
MVCAVSASSTTKQAPFRINHALVGHLFYQSSRKKIIYRKVCFTPKIEYSALQQEAIFVNAEGILSKPPSHSTLYRELRRRGLTNYKAKKRPKFTRAHAALRLKFAHEHRYFPWGQHTLKFSDECAVQTGSGGNQQWSYRFP